MKKARLLGTNFAESSEACVVYGRSALHFLIFYRTH